MDRVARMVERLPQFYRAWDRKSNFFQFLRGFSKALDEDQKLMFSVMRSHWIDTAYSSDLDLLGSLFRLSRRPAELDDSFRRRIKFFIPEFTGGGTRESIIAQTILYLDMRDQSPLLIENPPKDQILKKTVKHGDKWRVYSYSIDNEKPSISITIQGGGYRLPGPMISDLDTQSTVKFDGMIQSGQELVIEESGKAALDGNDVTAKLIKTGNIMMPRKGSSWTFHDSLTPIIGRFDEAVFDRNVYEMYIPTTSLEIKWNARLLASFELVVPENVLKNCSVTQSELEQMVDFIKASGVKSFVKIVSSLEDYEDRLKAEIERGRQAREAVQELERLREQQHDKRETEEKDLKIDEEQGGEKHYQKVHAEPQEQRLTQEEEQQAKGKLEQLQPTKEQENNQLESQAKVLQQLQDVDKVEHAKKPAQTPRAPDEEPLKSRTQEAENSEMDNMNNKEQNERPELTRNGKKLRMNGQQEEQEPQRHVKEKEPEQEREHEEKEV